MSNLFFGAVIYILNMTGKQTISRNILLLTSILNIALNWYLIEIYGIKGAAIATTISILFWNIIGIIYVKKIYGFWVVKI